MQLNNNKFELIIHKSSTEHKNLNLLKQLPFFTVNQTYNISDTLVISPSPFVKDLGIIIDTKLDWKLHIETITKKCKQLIYWILSVFYNRDEHTLMTLFNSLIRSKIEYGSMVWNPHLTQDIVKVEQIQRLFTSKIIGMNDYNYWERLQKLNLMSLQRRRERMIILHTWKILYGFTPNDINLSFKEHARTFAIRAELKPLPSLRGAILTKYDESFSIKAAKLWNVLPPNLTRLSSQSFFKTSLDKFLWGVPDEPPNLYQATPTEITIH